MDAVKFKLAAGLLLLMVAACSPLHEAEPDPVLPPPDRAPIAGHGHGVFLAPDGTELTPDAGFIVEAQAYYIHRLRSDAAADPAPPVRPDQIDATRARIRDAVPDGVLADALLLDWLIERLRPLDAGRLTGINNALRWTYYLDILGNPRPTDPVWTKGVEPAVADRLEDEGIPSRVLLRDRSAGGQAYVAQCRERGVPIPQQMFSAEWQRMGTFDPFISTASEAELWVHTSESPTGVCLALPRYPGGSCGSANDACLLGIICLGTETSNACFLDNPRGVAFRRNVPVPITEFVAGADLVANAQGVCSDCHAGENPFVVHPEKSAFAGLPPLNPATWHDPLVVPAWPRNPGPTNLLDAVASPGQCTSCHTHGGAGRFPEVSTEIAGYCGVVLNIAVGPLPRRTMPPFGLNHAQFAAHITALQNACGAPPTGGGVVVDADLRDDPTFVSPPIVIDPCYQCATKVAVRGAILDAEIEVFINGVSVATKTSRSPFKEELDVPALVAGDVVTATQTFQGATSSPSPAVTVRDHTVDFPAGLPAPEIDPTLLHECGDILAIRHVPGANLTVFSDGADPRTVGTSTGWTAMRPAARPFALAHRFTAQAELCGDRSPVSAEERPMPPPSVIPAPTLNPAAVYAGQELVNVETITYGATVNVSEATAGGLSAFSWPVSWYPDYDVATRLGRPLAAGDQLIIVQGLCDRGDPLETGEVARCEELPAPRIRHPQAGDTFVVITESATGARIRVYDAAGIEIGDGAGTVILLSRAITAADTLTVVQQLGECTSGTGYRVSVRLGPPRQDR